MKKTIVVCLAIVGMVLSANAMQQPSFHTKGTPTGRPTGPLKPGEYWWSPHASPQGPVVILVSLPQQIMNVYRNGILVGRTSVSTGTKGNQTPTGVFEILEKKEEHYSKKYDNAPMPHMQRLTWSGIAMHSGNLPGYPASHGCIRMPYDFSKHLFSVTSRGGTVVISDEKEAQPHFASEPGILLAPRESNAETSRRLEHGEYQWMSERSSKGPVSILVSSADRAEYVYRNGELIGRAHIEVSGRSLGGHVFTMLEGTSGFPSVFSPGRAGRNWMTVSSDARGGRVSMHDVAKRVRFSPEFGHKVYDVLSPGATIVVTDAPAVRHASRDFAILAD